MLPSWSAECGPSRKRSLSWEGRHAAVLVSPKAEFALGGTACCRPGPQNADPPECRGMPYIHVIPIALVFQHATELQG